DVKAGMERLQTEVILFVDHDPDAAGEINRRSRADRLIVQASQLLAHQMPLMKQESVLGWELVDPQQHTIVDRAEASERLSDLRQNPQPLAIARPWGERVALEIARQADSR